MALLVENNLEVGAKELNEVLTNYRLGITKYGVVNIEFQKPLNRVNIVFIAGLFLMYREKWVSQFVISGTFLGDRNREIKLYLYQIGKLYNVKSKWIRFTFTEGVKVTKEMFSSSFAPILLVNAKTSEYLFQDKSTLTDADSEIYRSTADTFIDKMTSRSEAKPFEIKFFDKKVGQAFRQDLAEKPFLFIIVFCLLYFKDNLKVVLNNKPHKYGWTTSDYKEFKDRLDELSAIAEDYFNGIHELSKNIVLHSSKKMGIITFRAYDTQEKGKDFESYVFDYGRWGIIQTLVRGTRNLLELAASHSFKPESLQEDMGLLSGDYHLKDFLNPSPTTILKQQMARQFVHIGLMTFKELITENNGVFYASTITPKGSDYYTTSGESDLVENKVLCKGTSFLAQLPMDSPRPRQKPGVKKKPGGMHISRKLTEVVNYKAVDAPASADDLKKKCICLIHLENSSVTNIESRIQEQEVVSFIQSKAAGLPDSITLAIDFDQIKLPSSSLLRILACISESLNKRLIVYNVDCSLLLKLVRENQRFLRWLLEIMHYSDTPYWIAEKAILLYSYSEVPDGSESENRRFYFADLLYGKDQNEFLSANRTISYSFHNIISNASSESPKSPVALRDEASQFFAGDALLPFDILLPTSRKNAKDCLFLQNLRMLLQKEFNPHEPTNDDGESQEKTPWEKYYKQLGGYSINNTHFRVGTKFHSSRFIFAKGVFQNSYHTTRLALQLVQRILEDIPKADPDVHITLVGYEMYSELLLGLTEDLMHELGFKNTDHFFVRNSSGGGIDQIQDPPKAIDLYYIVVPIVSTGSTSLRILRWMKNSLHVEKEPRMLFHLIAVIDPKEIENQKLPVGNYPTVEFITLNTTWYDPSSCPFCFLGLKAPLIEADKTSISPAMVYTLPRVKHSHALSDYDEDVKAQKVCPDGYFGTEFSEERFRGSLLYKCDRRNGEYNLFSHDELKFIKQNETDIINWLETLREKLNYSVTDKTVIVAPSRDSNIAFINLVNTYLFGYSATILYLQDNDYIENFKLTATSYLKDEHSRFKVVFVDDSIITGKSFSNTYSLINEIEPEVKKKENKPGDKKEENKPFVFDSTVVLINKATADVTRRLTKLTKSLHCFMSVNLPGFMTISEQKPFDLEIARYRELYEYCLFDRSKLHYNQKIAELTEFAKSSGGRPRRDNLDTKEDRHLKMLGATHRLLEHFQDTPKKEDSFKSIVKVAGYVFDKDKYSVFKTLCQPPFILHADILQAVFKYHTSCLNELIKDGITGVQIEDVKFLIRRAVFIKNHQIISSEFFRLLADLFGSEETATDKTRYKSLQYFILRQYTELIRMNGWCAGQIRDHLNHIPFNSIRGKQFKRMLLDSLGIVLHDFFDMLDSTPVYEKWKSIGFNKTEEDVKSFFGLSPAINGTSLILDIARTNKYQIVRNAVPELFQAKKELTLWDESNGDDTRDIAVPNDVFTRFLYIVACLRHDVQADESTSSIKLKKKTGILLESIRSLFGELDSVGAFFIVKNRRNDRTVVYDRDPDECHILTDSFLADKSKGAFLQVFLDYDSAPRRIEEVDIYDDQEDFRTFIELVPVSGARQKWRDRYLPKATYDLPVFSGYRWMYVLRLESMKRKHETKEIAPMGILCVYGKQKMEKNELDRKLLLLLRRDLSRFVHFHHRNDEFIDLIVAERTERFAYLAGHGRVVMQALTDYKIDEKDLSEVDETRNKKIRNAFKNVVMTMERMQYLFAMNAIDLDAPVAENRKVIRDKFSYLPLNENTMRQMEEDVSLMAHAIYESDIVEIEEKVDLNISVSGGSPSIWFYKDILMMIAFELIWNAKKNRFHLVRSLRGIIQEDFMNRLGIALKTEKRQIKRIERNVLLLTVSGTGPMVSPVIQSKINHGGQVKPDEMNSGLEMIQKVLKVLDDKNSLEITPAGPTDGVFTNIVTVEIYV